MGREYEPPVKQLLTLGMPEEIKFDWPDYLERGFTEEHIPELIRLALDEELHWADSDSSEVWGPVHAWRTLGQLQAEEAVEPLLPLLHKFEDSDWVGTELPLVMEMIGPAAIPALENYLAEVRHGEYPKITAAHALEKIGNKYPEARQRCIYALSQQLKKYEAQPPILNAFLISYLVDLQAVNAASLMEAAFAADQVDLSILGDWEDAQVEMGLLEERLTPKPEIPFEIPSLLAGPAKKPPKHKAAKKKARRKMAKASRKKQRKKKK